MKRFSRKWIAVASVAVAAIAALVVVVSGLPTTPPHRFLENHVPLVTHDVEGTLYEYEFEADFDSLAEQIAQEIDVKGIQR